jgi:hypothetical protein
MTAAAQPHWGFQNEKTNRSATVVLRRPEMVG